jgi:glycosyltransferase involved in cell wall biosynthesis
MYKICFIWQGVTDHYNSWGDGLHWAMKELEKSHEVIYREPWDEIPSDYIVFYWEAPCTINGKNSNHYLRVRGLPNKKALLFAGGAIQREWLDGFDHVFVESKINEQELGEMGFPHTVAFGTNTNIFKPLNLKKKWVGIHHGASASWKRQWLMAEALGDKCLVVGRFQEEDPFPFEESRRLGAEVMEAQPARVIAKLLNQSEVLIQSSEFWGGGQRATIEALACGIPVICMTDSPKNREYIEESGCGLVVEPDANRIREAVAEIQTWDSRRRQNGVEYIRNKWTHYHYADNLLRGVGELLLK